jgi:hypothetical protein
MALAIFLANAGQEITQKQGNRNSLFSMCSVVKHVY